MAQWPSPPDKRGETRWGFRPRLIILKSPPSLFLSFVFVKEFSFDFALFFVNDVFGFS